jgi:hypothetical protein
MSNPNEPQDPYGGYGSQQPPNGSQGGGASMGDGYSAPPPPPNYYGGGPTGPQFPSTEKNNLGTWALVLGILGIVCCGLFAAIPAIIVGNKSKEAAAQGLANNGQLGQVGFILGLVGVGLSLLGLVWVFLLGGLGMLTDPTVTGF